MLNKKSKKKSKKQSHDVFKIREQYSKEVDEYVRRNVETFIDSLAAICEKTSGRLTYDELAEMLGKDFPKAPWNDPDDRNANIRSFFEELEICCKADDTHIYFP